MQQACSHCGYESPASARFCRQCGAQLAAETEFSSAATRNYGRQTPPVSVPSAPLPPSVADAIAGETERYYQPPVAVMPVSTTAPIKSKRAYWRWLLLVLILSIGIAIGFLVQPPRDRTPALTPEQQAAVDALAHENDLKNELQDHLNQAQDQINQAKEQQMEALNQALEAARQAAEAGPAIAKPNEKLVDLTPYEYPNASVGNAIRIPGFEALTMRTPDAFEVIKEFYQKKLGKPVIEVNESWKKQLMFQSSSQPSGKSMGIPPISVSVETDYEHSGQMKITVLRLHVSKPDSEEAK